MKFQTLNLWCAALLVLMLTTGNTYSQNSAERIDNTWVTNADIFYEDILNLPNRVEKAQAVMYDNEIEQSEEGRDAIFFPNPLLLNGKPLEYADFSGASKGILTVVEGNPASPAATKIPFMVYLRRDGVIIEQGNSNINREVFEMEISKVLALAKNGDHLIIAPARKKDCKAKRILRVVDGC